MRTNWSSAMPFLVLSMVWILTGFSCQGGSGSSAPPPPSPYTQKEFPGNFLLISQRCYDHSKNTLPPLGNADEDIVRQRLNANIGTGIWTRREVTDDRSAASPGCDFVDAYGDSFEPGVSADDFFNNQAYNDFYWFTGHGNHGDLTLFSWDTSDPCASYKARCFSPNDGRLPFNGRLKWLFLNSSKSVVAQFVGDPAAWYSAFSNNPGSNGIHGIYGFYWEPGADAPSEQLLANAFFDAELQVSGKANPVAIHDAWSAGALASGHLEDAAYFELQTAGGDKLSGPPPAGQVAPYTMDTQHRTTNNPVQYRYWGPGPGQMRYSVTTLDDATHGVYQPVSLSTEQFSDANLAGQADTFEPGASKYYDSSNEYKIVSDSYTGMHYESSQGIMAISRASAKAMTFAQSDALAYAQNEVQTDGGGLPSDAVLDQQIADYSKDENGNITIIGYHFVWRHADGTRGGDMIATGVDNTSVRVCTTPNENDPPYNKPVCLGWTTQYNLRLNVLYRLWRTRSAPLQNTTPTISSRQAISIVASQALEKGLTPGNLVGYSYGYYTPPIFSYDNTAYPVYNYFYDSGTLLIADAGSGQIIGSSHY